MHRSRPPPCPLVRHLAVRDGPKYGGRRGGAPGGTEEVGCDAYAFNRPLNVRFGPDGCAYVVDYGAARSRHRHPLCRPTRQWPAGPDSWHRGRDHAFERPAERLGRSGKAWCPGRFAGCLRKLFPQCGPQPAPWFPLLPGRSALPSTMIRMRGRIRDCRNGAITSYGVGQSIDCGKRRNGLGGTRE